VSGYLVSLVVFDNRYSRNGLYRLINLGREMTRYGRGMTETSQLDPGLDRLYGDHLTLLSCALLHPRPIAAMLGILARSFTTLLAMITNAAPQQTAGGYLEIQSPDTRSNFRHNVSVHSELSMIIPVAYIVISTCWHKRGERYDVVQSVRQMTAQVVSTRLWQKTTAYASHSVGLHGVPIL
jgi:hypothetical protein